MSRYIDADKLDFICVYTQRCTGYGEACKECPDYACTYENVQEQPTVDAVEVVRCRDCKYYHEEGLFCESNSGGDSHANWYPNDFCSYGKRKEQE